MKKSVLVAVAVLTLAACSPKFQDLTTVEDTETSNVVSVIKDPDAVTIYRNVDQFANINVMCINGDAIISRSANYDDYFVTHIPAGSHNLCVQR